MCVATAKLFDGQRQFCGTHHNVKLRTDPAYLARITEFKTDPAVVAARAAFRVAFEHQQAAVGAARRRATAAVTAARTALVAAENAVRERQQPAAIEAEREAAARRARAQADNAAVVAAQLANARIANLRAAAVALLTAARAAHADLNAATAVLNQARDRASAALAVATDAETATAEFAAANAAVHAAIAEREVVIERCRHALNAFNAANDRYMIARGVAPAPVPQVFQRDPDGGIDLRAFAIDRQNVHRSGVLSAVEAAIHRLLERPLAADQNTIAEVLAVLPTPELRDELQRDFNLVHGFGVPYAKVLDHVWGTLRAHEHKMELEHRFIDELRDGRAMCHTGKMTRLVNVLAGFDDSVGDLMPPAELFRNRLALLTDRPLAERESAARDLFREFAIPEAEQAAWLEPLLEA
jgi:hypothetical protein